MARIALLLVTLLLVLASSGCTERQYTERRLLIEDGYALVRLDTFDLQSAHVRVALFDAAPGETYYLLLDAGQHVGWFDASPYDAKARACADRGYAEDACDPEGAGRFVGVSTGAAPIGVHLDVDLPGSCQEDGGEACPRYLALVVSPKPSGVRHAMMEVTTETPVSTNAPALTQLPIAR